ncbi:MAG TPA: hypothetical protein PKA13_10145 [Geminicoccaceae bacterium]|nr:hypothetical protein [Geminicoccus sp.]HMU50126.1 hypothetical protein [Geminicoccaceae bacterium]
MTNRCRAPSVVVGCLLLASCITPGGSVSQGTGGTAVTGAAAGAASAGADPSLERCSETLGTLAVDDGREQYWWHSFYSRTQITDIEPMIRTIVQQSNCFVVTAAGNQRLTDRIGTIKSRTRDSGEFRAGSNYQKGQAIASDYFLEPSILFADSDAGGLGGAVGGLLGSVGAAVGGALMRQSHTTVNLTLVSIREEAQIAASEGSASASDLGAAIAGFAGPVAGGLGAYTKTPEGKATVAAFVDAYNKLVVALRNYEAQTVKGGLGRGGTLKMGQ